LWAMAMDGPVAAGIVHWLLGLLFAGATTVLATPIVGRRWAWVAMSAGLVVPGVTNQMTAPMNDVALAAATTVALAAWYRAVVLEEGRRWLLVAGIAAGGALAIKYLALLFALAMVAGCLWAGRRGGARRRLVLESAAVIAVVSAGVAGPWYARAAWHRGNPVYPFFSEVFPAQGPVYADPHETLPASKSKLGRTPSGALAAAWQVTMHPERLGGRAHQPGVLFLAVLPGLALVRRLRGLGTLLVIGAAYGSAWYLLRQNVRFLLPLIPIAAVAAVWVVAEMRRFPPTARLAGRLLVCGILAAYAGLAALRCSGQAAVATGVQRRSDYLAVVEPTWRAAEMSNLWFGTRGSLLSTDYRALYFDCPVTRENALRRHTGYHRQIERPEQLVPLLRGKGFTHLLLAENLGRQGAQFDATLATLVANCRAACGPASLPVLAEYTFEDLDRGRRRYQLVLVR
ncbi:MAG: glycosyltransferase family 39 protein, partial [Planctomycetota bacterium]|nr:glycosyltransferase family 39 protein [Planctomycetota bacterium]